MDENECYDWGNTFAAPWAECVAQMSSRATALGLEQDAIEGCVTWRDGDDPKTRFLFVEDPSDIEAVRRIYNDEGNIRIPTCFIVVRQPDASETRGDIIFDIFRLSPVSYLWHYNRVYTPPRTLQ
jgi:hypothetical protein